MTYFSMLVSVCEVILTIRHQKRPDFIGFLPVNGYDEGLPIGRKQLAAGVIAPQEQVILAERRGRIDDARPPAEDIVDAVVRNNHSNTSCRPVSSPFESLVVRTGPAHSGQIPLVLPVRS